MTEFFLVGFTGKQYRQTIPVKEEGRDVILVRMSPRGLPQIDGVDCWACQPAGNNRWRCIDPQHVRFRIQDGVLQVRECGSTNGTWINDSKLDPQDTDTWYDLALGDRINVANVITYVVCDSQPQMEPYPEAEEALALLHRRTRVSQLRPPSASVPSHRKKS